jgi:hypothetical protein
VSGSSTAEREQFLVGLIMKALKLYERGEIGLGRLVADVESGVDALLDLAENGWVEELRSAWSGLEIVYAVALDEGRAELTCEERDDVDETIAELRGVLAARSSA